MKNGTGSILNPFDHRDISVLSFDTLVSARPNKKILDLSCVTPKNQLSHGSCVGHAESTAIEYSEYLDRGVAVTVSPRDLYSECKKRDKNLNQGTYPRQAGLVLIDRGVASNEEIPNDCTLPYAKYIDTPSNVDTAILTRQKGFASAPIDYNWIADQIAKGRIVTFTIPTMGADLSSQPAKPSLTTIDGWHRVAFYGYEDISATDGVLYWVNSWGDTFGFKVQGLGGMHGCNTMIFSEWKTKLGDLQVYTDIPIALIEKARASSKDFVYTFNNNLKRGMKGVEVKALQKALLFTGDFYKEFYGDQLETDYFGSTTELSVRRFQGRMGLPITGFVGQMTRSELNKLLSVKKKS